MIKKVIIYLSSYLPIFVVLWLKDVLLISFSIMGIGDNNKAKEWVELYLNPYLITELLVMVAIAVSMFILIRRIKNITGYLVKINSVKNRTSEYYLAYSSLFIISLISLSFTNILDICVLLMIVSILGVVYIKNDLYFINPTINLFYNHIYEIECECGVDMSEDVDVKNKLIISDKRIEKGDFVEIALSEYEFSFLKGGRDEV